MTASANGHIEAVKYLVDRGAPIDVKTGDGVIRLDDSTDSLMLVDQFPLKLFSSFLFSIISIPVYIS